MVWAKKAQSGAAVLVVLIALLIILYVLFLPPAERAILLGEEPPTDPHDPGAPSQPPPSTDNVLYSTQPMIVTPRGPEEHPLPTITIRTVTSGNMLAERSGVVVERSVFHQDTQPMSFSLPEGAENVYLSFIARDAKGDLRVRLNGEVVFDSAVTQRQPSPIRLHDELLESHNTLEFSVSGVGFRFWDTNRYALSEVRVSGDVTSTEFADHTQRVVLRDKDSVDAAQLAFVVECEERSGRLSVQLNSQTVYSGLPECGMPVSVNLGLSRLQEDENTLSWSVDSGAYTIYDAAFIVHRTPELAIDSFIISQELYNRVVSSGGDFKMRLSFAEPGAEGVIRLNGEDLSFRTHRLSFTAPITSYVRPGQNVFSVIESDPHVVALEVLYD